MTDRLDLKTPDGVSQNIERIAALFPHCVTETADGKQIDFDLLRQELSADIVEGPKERYRLEWPGKREAIVTANMPTTNTLRPVREDSVNFDTTENLYIEGDNLEVLKLLQESYLGKIKMIDIDPPYNTGNDFVYKDNFTQDTEEFKADSGMTDDLGNRLVANPETSGRYHSDWLTMMYPRLKLARNLLTDDGVIFIHIDDNEVHNLRKMCDEVFGEVNFVANVIWERSFAPINLKKHFSENHDFIVVYAKSLGNLINNGLPRSDEAIDRYKNPDNDPRGPWQSDNLSVGPAILNKIYEITTPGGRKVMPPDGRCWLLTQERYQEFINDNRIWFGEDGNNVPRIKRFLSEVKNTVTPFTIWKYSEVGHSQDAAQKLKELFDGKDYFDYPKSIELIKRILVLYSNSDSIILDFFSGSATTAHAVMQLNAEDGGNRKFIMVQLPEKTDEKSEAYKAGYQNICEIGKERIRRAGKKIAAPSGSPEGGEKERTPNLFDNAESAQLLPSGEVGRGLDVGFRVYRLDTSNMQDVYYRPQDYKQDMMTELFANHIKPDRTPDDLVAQVMLDWGLPLSLPINQTTIAGKTVYKVAGNALYCCFDEQISEDFARAVAPEKPLRIVFHDYAFANDTAKENVRQLLKQLSGETEMRVV
jgi:adenine-specific DNA-methyltransferase